MRARRPRGRLPRARPASDAAALGAFSAPSAAATHPGRSDAELLGEPCWPPSWAAASPRRCCSAPGVVGTRRRRHAWSSAPVAGTSAPPPRRAPPARSARATIYAPRRAPAWSSSAPRGCVEPERSPFDVAGTDARPEATGSGFVIDDDGHDPHQRARRRRTRPSSRSRSTTTTRCPRRRRRQGPRHRPRAAAGRAPDGLDLDPLELGDSSSRPGRRPDGRDRQPLRARADAHHRRRLRAGQRDHRARAASASTT